MSDTRLRFTGLGISALAMCGLMAYGCKKADRPEARPAPEPARTMSAPIPAPTPTPSPAPAGASVKSAPAKPADGAPLAAKPAAPAGPKSAVPTPTKAADPAPEPGKKPPVPHTELARDAKPLSAITTPTGVVVEEHKVGAGEPLLPGGGATFHMVGRLKDGWKTIQDTYADGEPITAAFGQMLPGLADGLVGMRPGGVRRLTIPASRGFQNREPKNEKGEVVVPAGSTLVYDIELVAVRQSFVPTKPPEPVKLGQPAAEPPDMNK